MGTSFVEKLTTAIRRNRSLLCVGLDPDPRRYPAHFGSGPVEQELVSWGRRIIQATADLVCCYKPNIAFYEQFGVAGLTALEHVIAAVPDDIPVLLDAKRGDIGSTAVAYARAAFETWHADAVTVNPYLGRDAVAPFLAYPGKMAFVLCYTSNPSAATIQEFRGTGAAPDMPGICLFEHIARQAQAWGDAGQIGFVVGATQPQALAQVRQVLAGRSYWILAPGVGAQGGDLAAALAAGLDERGSGLIVPVSRGIIYAEDPRAAALRLRAQITPSPPHLVIPFHSHPLILQLHDAGCIQFGEFTLASGKRSPIYLDLRRMASYPQLLRAAAMAYATLLRPLAFDYLAAVPYAALTIGTAVALAMERPLIYPRKEAKAYGIGQAVEGVFETGRPAVVLEDLVTSGGSVLRAITTLEEAGLQVSDVVVLIDREQGGPQQLAAKGYRLHAVLSLTQIVDTLQATGRISEEQAVAVRTYLESQRNAAI